MPVDKRDRIFPGDSLVFSYECKLADAYGTQTSVTPIAAFARVMEKPTQTFLAVGPVGDSGHPEAPVLITPEANGRGAILTYVLSEDITNTAGSYVVYITAIFADGTILTEDRSVRVMEFR